MAATNASPSPSPPPAVPQASQSVHSHRYTAFKRIHTDFIRQSLKQNSYENFSSCFPTPAKYCPTALEGVWKQLNTRLEEECVKDFEKLCVEREVEAGLAGWEVLVEDAKGRKTEWEKNGGHDGEDGREGEKALHELSAQELYNAHAVGGLVRAEKELTRKLDTVQHENRGMIGRIEEQRGEMRRLVDILEGLVGDVEGAARAVEEDEMRDEIRKGVNLDVGGDVKMIE